MIKKDLTREKSLIAVVDDDHNSRKFIKATLLKAGYRVAEAPDKKHLVAILKENLPDLIVLDATLPDTCGFKTCKSLRDKWGDRIPIILLTSSHDTKSRSKGWKAGCDEFLTKPINSVELLARVKNLLKLQELSRQLNSRLKAMEQICSGKLTKEAVEGSDALASVLLVEDSKYDQLLLKSYLEEDNYEIVITGRGQKALELAAKGNFDLIILDLYLPDINGLDVLKEFRQNNSTRYTPVIIITARDEIETKVIGLEAGANDYLIKPVNKLELKARVKALLKSHKLQNYLLGNYIQAAEKAIKDGLTGLYNHSYLKTFLEGEISYSSGLNKPLSLLMMDLDDFKDYNDTNGHLAGDHALKETADIIAENIRSSDLAARYGGEEFAVVLPHTPCEEAKRAAERIRKRVEQHKYNHQTRMAKGNLTISIGVTEYVKGMSSTDLIKRADSALYQAKKRGKNNVVCF